MTIQMLIVAFLFGIGFGYLVQRAGLCFAHGLGEIFIGKGKRICRMFVVIFVITCLGFWLSSIILADGSIFGAIKLGLKPIGHIRGYGFYNLAAGMLFGAGIALNGGCILGTLRQIGEGNLTFLVVFVSFIPGMALVVYKLDPLLKDGYFIQKIVLPKLFGAPAGYVVGVAVIAALGWFWALRIKKIK